MLYDRQKKQDKKRLFPYTGKIGILNAFMYKRYIVSYCFNNGLNCLKNREKQYIMAIAAAGNIVNRDAANIPEITIISIIPGMYTRFDYFYHFTGYAYPKCQFITIFWAFFQNSLFFKVSFPSSFNGRIVMKWHTMSHQRTR